MESAKKSGTILAAAAESQPSDVHLYKELEALKIEREQVKTSFLFSFSVVHLFVLFCAVVVFLIHFFKLIPFFCKNVIFVHPYRVIILDRFLFTSQIITENNGLRFESENQCAQKQEALVQVNQLMVKIQVQLRWTFRFLE